MKLIISLLAVSLLSACSMKSDSEIACERRIKSNPAELKAVSLAWSAHTDSPGVAVIMSCEAEYNRAKRG